MVNIFRNSIKTYQNIRKIAVGQGNAYVTGCLLDYPFFLKKKIYKLIEKDLSKQQGIDADSKAIQQINFTGDVVMLSILEEVKEAILDLSQRNLTVFSIYFCFYKIAISND